MTLLCQAVKKASRKLVGKLRPRNTPTMLMTIPATTCEEGEEANTAWEALVAAHPIMASWPVDHSWFIGKLEISNVWLINIFGGATNITPEEYYAADE